MEHQWIDLTIETVDSEHLCCAIADKKHQAGVQSKKQWLKQRFEEGHVFRKLDARGKVLIEYAPLETAWVPIEGDNYVYIYCLWVAGSFKGQGLAKELLESCMADAKAKHKAGVCVLSSKKKKPYLSDANFFKRFGFEVADTAPDDFELLALSFDGTMPRFVSTAKAFEIETPELTIYYGMQCPFLVNSIEQVRSYCETNAIPLRLVAIDSLEKAKALPFVPANYAVFQNGKFVTHQLLNENLFKKKLGL
ncbi:GNAT family N-acetyltransferase [uncultured Dubosiella sp.]|uniref:GNAT family N-acetyltransferase n=1 Tax=uncultured Dubosiella sp. TaxID=1937011 RepID=UPI0025B1A5B6|nr:GNAT family N-acetyltransferase [uncultured Dubosiella sp.]